jgi:hypothetical protein
MQCYALTVSNIDKIKIKVLAGSLKNCLLFLKILSVTIFRVTKFLNFLNL